MIVAAMLFATLLGGLGIVLGSTCVLGPRSGSRFTDGFLSASAFALAILWLAIAFQLAARLP